MLTIKQIQTKLLEAGFSPGPIDGVWGPKTNQACCNYQIANGVEVPVWIHASEGELLQREVTGSNHNPRILSYHSSTDQKPTTDEVSWCSSFVNYVLRTLGFKGTNSVAARSWLNGGTALPNFKFGAIVVFWRVAKTSWQGHVGFAIWEDKDSIAVLGGNQSNQVNVSVYSKNQLLGFRWPVRSSAAPYPGNLKGFV